MKRILTLFCAGMLVFPALGTNAQAPHQKSFDPRYRRIQTGDWVLDKNFYVLTALTRDSSLMATLAKDPYLSAWGDAKRALLRAHISDTCKWPESLLGGFLFSRDDSSGIIHAMGGVYDRQYKEFGRLVEQELRPSGCYIRLQTLSDKDLFLSAFAQVIVGVNQIIDQYGLGRHRHYASIDSASYDVHGGYYRDLLKTMFPYLEEKIPVRAPFFGCSLSIALQLLRANDRDEAGRYEPLALGENKRAVLSLPAIRWSVYTYAAILVPGEGPEIPGIPFDPIGRMRCDLAAMRYKRGLAPFIIVSGGDVHPFHTPYTEALEMKKYLLAAWHIPESAVVLEPHARHTTTNFRNANRLALRYGFPSTKPFLCVTTKDQADYIMEPGFDERNLHELGYLPYLDKTRLSDHEIMFRLNPECLEIDPRDPLDP